MGDWIWGKTKRNEGGVAWGREREEKRHMEMIGRGWGDVNFRKWRIGQKTCRNGSEFFGGSCLTRGRGAGKISDVAG